MEDQLQCNSGRTQGVDQVNIASMEVKPEVTDHANAPDDGAEPRTAAPRQQSHPIPLLPELRMPKDNEKSIFSTITGQPSAQDTPKLACTPRPLAQPRRYGPGTGYEVRMPANMTPARIYRSSFGPDTRQMRNAATAHQESERRILPIGELITSHGNRTYTLWANEQHKTTNRIAIQVIITNNNSTTTFKSYSGVSRRSPLEVLDDFGSLLRVQGIALMSLNVVEDSFLSVVSTDKGWKELREGILHAAR
ncbi:hypothetical protein KCU77_g189, partial [Aureobasidium melanogenum]